MQMSSLEHRIAGLERRAWWLGVICFAQFLFMIAVWLSAGFRSHPVLAQASAQVVKTRGLIIEDDQGRARILMGAPFPDVPGRMRQDPRTSSILFLDQEGHDRLTLGEELEPQIDGKVPVGIHRIASGFGVVIHDGQGNERGAYGWLSNGRALLTLDRPGAEAFAAVVNDKSGETKVSLSFPPEVASDTSAIDLGTRASTSFLRFNSKNGQPSAVLSTEGGVRPSFKTIDPGGQAGTEWIRPKE
jgi:hypothetical protein